MATLLCYTALLSYAFALPTSLYTTDSPSIDSSVAAQTAVSDAPAFDTSYRSTVEIVWSCLTVIFASSWLCVHPNVTGYNTTMWQRFVERLKLFAIAIFAPEFLAVFAFYQWLGCRQLHQKFRARAEALGISLVLLPKIPKAANRSETLENPGEPEAPTVPGSSEDLGNPGVSENEPIPADVASSSESRGSKDLSKPAGRPIPCPPSVLRNVWQKIAWSSFSKLADTISHKTNPGETAWTYTHAHFIQMGGTAMRNDDGEIGFKRPEDWDDEEMRNFFAMRLSQAAISDKSKAGALAKTLVVARVLWFLVQTIVRASQRLPISLLEVASLAFIAFNFAMYVCWWDKPLDVECPLEIPGAPDQKAVKLNPSTILTMFVGILDATTIGVWKYSPRRERYPRLYCFGKHEDRDVGGFQYDPVFNLTLTVTSSIFGVLHAVGWHLPAPSLVERMLWRISCLVLMLYPILLSFFALTFAFLNAIVDTRRGALCVLSEILLSILAILSFFCVVFYVGARLAILVLPFFELRALPTLVHRTVSWSRFINPV